MKTKIAVMAVIGLAAIIFISIGKVLFTKMYQSENRFISSIGLHVVPFFGVDTTKIS